MTPSPQSNGVRFMPSISEARYQSLDDLAAALEEQGQYPPEYWDKQVHRVPAAAVVDREAWLLERCVDKTVLHIGCAGPLHQALREVATRAYGIDQEKTPWPETWALDVERLGDPLPPIPGLELVLLPEILEHLTMPGLLLRKVREAYPGCGVIVTTPNAGSVAFQAWLKRGYENVNRDHCCWFSWRTLTTLVEKCGYAVEEWYWYRGRPLYAEGLIFVVR